VGAEKKRINMNKSYILPLTTEEKKRLEKLASKHDRLQKKIYHVMMEMELIEIRVRNRKQREETVCRTS
jgi:hypothetical protein